MNEFYVYSYSTEKDGLFYVGKGSNKRIKESHKDSPYCYNVLRKRKKENIEIKKEKIFVGLTEQIAHQWEKILIWFYEPKTNLTNGGEGSRGYKFTEEQRKWLSNNHWDTSGENNPSAVLNQTIVNKIRKEYKETNITQKQLEKKYSIGQPHISRILRNVSWFDSDYKYVERPKKLTIAQANEIRNKFIPRTYTRKMLAREYDVSEALIKKILMKEYYK